METENRTLKALIRATGLAAFVGLLLVAPAASWACGDDDDDEPSSNAAALANMRTMMEMMNHNQDVVDAMRSRLASEREDQAERIAAYQAQQRAAAQEAAYEAQQRAAAQAAAYEAQRQAAVQAAAYEAQQRAAAQAAAYQQRLRAAAQAAAYQQQRAAAQAVSTDANSTPPSSPWQDDGSYAAASFGSTQSVAPSDPVPQDSCPDCGIVK